MVSTCMHEGRCGPACVPAGHRAEAAAAAVFTPLCPWDEAAPVIERRRDQPDATTTTAAVGERREIATSAFGGRDLGRAAVEGAHTQAREREPEPEPEQPRLGLPPRVAAEHGHADHGRGRRRALRR